MKTRFCLVFLFLTGLVAASCEKIDNEPETGGPDPIEDPTLWLWTGEDTLLRVDGDLSAYTVSTDLEEVATAEVTDEGILITAGRYGNTVVHLDAGGDRRHSISVRSMLLAGDWENLAGDENYMNGVVVDAADAVFAEELAAELLEKFREETERLIGYRFSPYVNSSTGELDSARFMKFSHTAQQDPILRPASSGSYSFGELSLTLQPSGDNEKEVYRLLPYPDRMILGLQRDLTPHYQDLYPDKGIRQVTVTRHLKQWLPPG